MVVVVAVALWLVFTPKQLTRIVNSVVPRFVQAETRFGNVDLTLLSTFPDAGLVVDDVYIVNRVEGAPSDTLARIGKLTVGLDVKAFLKEKKVIVHQVLLDRAQANLYIGPDTNNFSIFPTSDSPKEDDTSAASLPVLIDINRVKVSDMGIRFANTAAGMDATVEGLDLALRGRLDTCHADATLKVDGRQLALTMTDSSGAASLDALLQGLCLTLDGKGDMDEALADLSLKVRKGILNAAGTDMVNPALQASKADLITLKAPLKACISKGEYALTDKGRLTLADYALDLQGQARLAHDTTPMWIDATLATDGSWQVQPLLALVPAAFMGWQQGMEVDGKATLAAHAEGTVAEGRIPLVSASVQLADGRFHYPQALPYKVNKISADIDARLDLSEGGKSSAVINSLKARTQQTSLGMSGKVDDLTGDMLVDAAVTGSTLLADLRPLLPDTLPLDGQAKADIDLKARFRMSQVQAMDLQKMNASGTIRLKEVDMTYDSLHAVAPSLDIALRLPSTAKRGRMADASVKGGRIEVEMPASHLTATLQQPEVKVSVNDMMHQQLAADFDISLGHAEAAVDTLTLRIDGISLNGSAALDSTQQNILRQYNPRAAIKIGSAVLNMPALPDAVHLSSLDLSYEPEGLDIRSAEVEMGRSDFALDGNVKHIEPWLSHEGMLSGDLNLTSNYADVDQLMDLFSGMGSDPDTLEQMRREDSVPAEANPFIVPKDVDITFNTHIRHSLAFGNDLSDVQGALTVNDGTAVLNQVGFVCKAATMQLTALYQSPRPNNLFVALDFHLLDILIDELIDMIPTIDTLVPMLSAFEGSANFHLAAETFLNAKYEPKMSSLLGSAAITGKDLVVLDNSNIATIAKLMRFKSWKEKDDKIHIDSLDVELSCFRKEIEVFPFLLNIGKYQICASGKHTLDNVCNYHVELLKNPLLAKVGVDVKGPLSSPKISLGEVRYADLFKPQKQGVVEKRVREQKEMIKRALESNVR